ncbi:hypothetical protein EW146_g2819 [Bondarzewia mesenterica]|uniref:HMG box domain-containing protein n=1 Tax=Bondarzewia mesenterica TaxID=1095465 RepID=A0A4S4M1E1_9AGAM|nr:hypothetical protein EW146_g2819 [Bondarzewia mesenterica]
MPRVPSSAKALRKKDAHIPRPPNAFIIFRRLHSTAIKEQLVASSRAVGEGADVENSNIAQAALSKTASTLWRAMSREEQQPYYNLAEVEKQEHATLYPDYQYAPKKKAEKEKNSRQTKAEVELLETSERFEGKATIAPALRQPNTVDFSVASSSAVRLDDLLCSSGTDNAQAVVFPSSSESTPSSSTVSSRAASMYRVSRSPASSSRPHQPLPGWQCWETSPPPHRNNSTAVADTSSHPSHYTPYRTQCRMPFSQPLAGCPGQDFVDVQAMDLSQSQIEDLLALLSYSDNRNQPGHPRSTDAPQPPRPVVDGEESGIPPSATVFEGLDRNNIPQLPPIGQLTAFLLSDPWPGTRILAYGRQSQRLEPNLGAFGSYSGDGTVGPWSSRLFSRLGDYIRHFACTADRSSYSRAGVFLSMFLILTHSFFIRLSGFFIPPHPI